MEWLLDPKSLVAFVSLVLLELVLNVDNVIFISILVGKLPPHQRARARYFGLGLAVFARLALLCSIAWLATLTKPLFHVYEFAVSGRDLVMIAGGAFLIAKSTQEIHQRLEGESGEESARVWPSLAGVITQIILLDIVFSLDSVIAAVGMANKLSIMVSVVVIAALLMLVAATAIGEYVERHPTVKMLALAFLLLVGVVLVADGFHQHIGRGYVYFSMAFSCLVEILNIRARKKAVQPVKLHEPYTENGEQEKAEQAGDSLP